MTKIKKMPFMPLYFGDWFSSRTVNGLSLAGQGLFVRLLLLQWDTGPLPDAFHKIAPLIGNPAGIEAAWSEVEHLFPVFQNHRLNSRGWEIKQEWDALRLHRAEAGKIGGAASARAKQDSSKIQANGQAGGQPKLNPSDSYSDSDSDSASPDKEGPPTAAQSPPAKSRRRAVSSFIPPEESDVVEFCKAELGVVTVSDAALGHVNEFLDHFRSNGWKVGGKTPMIDWHAAWRNWVRRINYFTPAERPQRRFRR
jgi:uncharacterized protein YdaU (DUF1376 family)